MTLHSSITTLTLLFLLLPAWSFADDAAERQFVWNEANSIMASAEAPEEFLVAAQTYQKLIEIGVQNGPLFYNLGTAMLMAERYDEALNALLRAERYMGSNWDIRRNMLMAKAGKKENQTVSLAWYRLPLFWHYGLSCTSRLNIIVCAFAVFWIGMLFRIWGGYRFFVRIMVVSLTVLILFGSSVATSIHQEREADRQFQWTTEARHENKATQNQ